MNTSVVICNNSDDLALIKTFNSCLYMNKGFFYYLVSKLSTELVAKVENLTLSLPCHSEAVLKIIDIVCAQKRITLLKGEYDEFSVIMEKFGLENYMTSVECFPKVNAHYKFANHDMILMNDNNCIISNKRTQLLTRQHTQMTKSLSFLKNWTKN